MSTTKKHVQKRPSRFRELDLGIAIGLQAFVILLVSYYFDRAIEVGVCCCIMGAMTVLGLALRETK